MKRLAIMVAVALLTAGAAACGGGDSTGGGGTTPTTTTQAMGTTYQIMNGSSTLMTQVMTAIANAGAAGAQVVKEASVTVTCNEGATANSWTCTVTDGQGGTATMTGTATMANNLYSFDFDSVFTNFKPNADTTIDGSFKWIVSMNPAAYGGGSAQTIKGNIAKSEDQCQYTEEDISGEGLCAETSNVCSSSSTDHILHFEYIIGADGLTFTDVCGTFTYSPNTTMTMDYCSVTPETSALFSGTINGTFNGTSVNETYNYQCNWSQTAS